MASMPAPKLMGIINATPDSFSADGLRDVPAIVAHAMALYKAGADILDIGGESTRPGSQPIGPEEEQRRVIPVIKAIAGQVGCSISIDTYNPSTAAMALDVGANIINDVMGGHDPNMLGLIADRGCQAVLMHNMAATVDDDNQAPSFIGEDHPDFLKWLVAQLSAIVDRAVAAGVQRQQLILDPGIGFGKTVSQNLQIVKNAYWLETVLGLPILLGFSNKSFIGKVLNVNVDDRLSGNMACVAEANCGYIRVHDVAATKQFITMREALAAA